MTTVCVECKETFPLGIFLFENINLHRLPQFLEALPARLVVHFGRHWIRDTNHTAADQPFAASKQYKNDAEASVSNSSLKHDHQKHEDDEINFRTRSRTAREISFSVS